MKKLPKGQFLPAIAVFPGFRILRYDEDKKSVVSGGSDAFPEGMLSYLKSDKVEMGMTGGVTEDGIHWDGFKEPAPVKSTADIYDALTENSPGFEFDFHDWVMWRPEFLELK